jgi:hypothetical protein
MARRRSLRGHTHQFREFAMLRIRKVLPLVLAAGAFVLAGCASTDAVTEWDGLVRQPNTRLNAVFLKPNAQVAAYRSVMLDPVQVSFDSNWDPNRGTRSMSARLNADDVAAIKSDLAELFREIFRDELARGGYQLVDQPGPETLRVTPAIINLFINAPDTSAPGRTRTYTADSGRMTLVAELRDSETGTLLARAVDTQTGRNAGMWTISNRVTNTADARRAIGVWASALRRGLDELYGKAGS